MDIDGKLRKACAKRTLVHLHRDIDGADRIAGFVLAVGVEWILLARLDPGIFLDGYTFVRREDLRRVEKPASRHFVRRALELHGEWPPVAPEHRLDGIVPVLESAAAAFPLLTVHVERADPEVCYIGTPVKIGRRALRLAEVTPSAEWTDEPSKWRFADITRVECGGRYERTLSEVAGLLG
ncbi:hypothetical protein [Amycolatopsis samaneae]|uniref:Uncharacterized protein n=1 Tax=Amycolatopsis samaneae TaxID=664691 RepID=A0ABW5GND4_9PSEU